MDLNEIEKRVHRAYEWGRAKRAAVLSVVVAAASAAFVSAAPHVSLAAGLATALTAATFVFLWRGQELERGLLTGMVAGSVPLLLAFAARPFGHGCEIGGQCYSWCLPACALGGAIATAIVARAARRSNDIPAFGVAAGFTTMASGALGCTCVSLGGALALVAVFVLSAVPALAYVARQRPLES